MRICSIPLLLAAAGGLLPAQPAATTFTSYAEAKAVLDAPGAQLPAELQGANAAKWSEWSHAQDAAIRARLEQGDLDSMVNLLLLGTSFTKQPRVPMDQITPASKNGVLNGRVEDLVAGIFAPGDNERLQFLNGLFRRRGVKPGDATELGVRIYTQLLRVMQERKALAERAAALQSSESQGAPGSGALLDRGSLFSDRGVSLDTSILPSFSIEQTLRDLKQRGVLREGQVARVAVIGPGLDFIDKNEQSAYDYYPQQTLQPFALSDSLVRLGLAAAGGPSVTIFDISPRVLDHIERARERARKDTPYTIQLPRDVSRPWPTELASYWKSLGGEVGREVTPLPPPAAFPGLETRAVAIRPEAVLACDALDLNIVLQRLELPEDQRFDLIVGTNIFLYYDSFQQSLALENAGAMLKPGGLLLTNDRLPEVPGGTMRPAGITEVPFGDTGSREAVGWYRRL